MPHHNRLLHCYWMNFINFVPKYSANWERNACFCKTTQKYWQITRLFTRKRTHLVDTTNKEGGFLVFVEELLFRFVSSGSRRFPTSQASRQNAARIRGWRTLRWGTLGRSRPWLQELGTWSPASQCSAQCTCKTINISQIFKITKAYIRGLERDLYIYVSSTSDFYDKHIRVSDGSKSN